MEAAGHHDHKPMPTSAKALNSVAFSATLHCLTGCAIGEVAGMIIGTALGFSNLGTIVLAIGLAFLFGYSFTSLPLLRAGFVALVIAYPVNRWLITRGKGHAVLHETGIHGGPPTKLVAAIAAVAAVFGTAVLVAEAFSSAGEGHGEFKHQGRVHTAALTEEVPR